MRCQSLAVIAVALCLPAPSAWAREFGTNDKAPQVSSGARETGPAGRQESEPKPEGAAPPATAAWGKLAESRAGEPAAPAGPASSGEAGEAAAQGVTEAALREALELVEKGDTDGARRSVQTALSVRPGDPGLAELDRRLEPKVRGRVDAVRLRGQLKSWLEARPSEGFPEGQGALYAVAGPAASGFAPAPGAAARAPAGAGVPRIELEDGVMRLKLGDYRTAERFFTARLQQDPQNAVAYRFRAMARRAAKDLAAARADAARAVGLNPRDVGSRQTLALVLLDQGRPREAATQAELALELEPKNAELWRLRALARERLGDRTGMLADLKQAAALDEQFRELYRRALDAEYRGSGALAPSRAFPWSWIALSLAGLMVVLGARRGRLGPTATTPAPAPGPAAPQAPALNGFELGPRIGRGGMGEVYEAMDLALGRPVAIKRLRDELASDPREGRRFLREARTVAALKHPNIVEIYHAFEQDGALYLVFERVPGRPLSELLAERGALAWPEAIPIARQVAAALDYAHGAGVVHRDLKPSNIMLAGADAKVMDFGIARRLYDTLSTASLGEVVGTPQYMAPEQERGEACPQTDVFALGVCLYELLAGRPPASAEALRRRGELEPLATRLRLSSDVDAALARAVAPSPSERFPTAGAFLAALAAG